MPLQTLARLGPCEGALGYAPQLSLHHCPAVIENVMCLSVPEKQRNRHTVYAEHAKPSQCPVGAAI